MNTRGSSQHYLIIGGGRMATHMRRYLDLEGQACLYWVRGDPLSELRRKAADATAALVLISDDAICGFLESHASILGGVTCVHFSGSLVTERAHSFHPLASFGRHLYELHQYREIGFVCDEVGPKFPEVFPALKNPWVTITPDDRALYHAWAVISGNFTTILWDRAFERMGRLGIPRSHVMAYMRSVHNNISSDTSGSLTGPLARGDVATMRRNLAALKDDDFAGVYRAFARIAGFDKELQ